MDNKTFFLKPGRAGLVLGAVLLATLTGCIGYVDGPRAEVQVEPGPFAVQDDYVYYPGYDVYYSSHRRQYAYMEGGAWVSRPAPRGVSIDRLRASPSVRMDFHDSPAQHHAAVVQKYPRNWAPPGANSGHSGNPKDNDRGNNRER